jgi:hypothetical protein
MLVLIDYVGGFFYRLRATTHIFFLGCRRDTDGRDMGCQWDTAFTFDRLTPNHVWNCNWTTSEATMNMTSDYLPSISSIHRLYTRV